MNLLRLKDELLETPEFFFERMIRDYGDSNEYSDELQEAVITVEEYDRRDSYTVIHGDLFQHNFGFKNGLPTTVVDWERVGYFDPLYDSAFCELLLEMVYLPQVSDYTNTELRSSFREILGVSNEAVFCAYKVLPAYIALQNIQQRDERRICVPVDYVRKILNDTITTMEKR